jgi:hypothetical protein
MTDHKEHKQQECRLAETPGAYKTNMGKVIGLPTANLSSQAGHFPHG